MAGRFSVLGELATVRTISLFRDRHPEYSLLGNVAILTIKDLTSAWPIDFSALHVANVDAEYLPQALKNGDILLPARGDYYPARYIFSPLTKPIFPVGQIHVITAKPDGCPGFLAWYLNQAEAQAAIRTRLTGTNIQSLNKSRLIDLPIGIPPRAIQEKIAKIQEIHLKRTALHHELIKLQDQEVEAGCIKLLNHED